MKTTKGRSGPYWLIALTIIFSLILSACGDATPANTGSSDFGNSAAGTGSGQVASACDGKGEVSGQILVLTDPNKELQNAPATLKLTAGSGGETKTITTEADGTYSIKDLDVNEYELEATIPTQVDGKTIESRKKYLTVDDCFVETVSMVLVAQGIEIPPAPAPTTTQQQVVYVNNQPHYSITSNPFFWLWLMDRPNYYGYNYPPSYTTNVYHTNNTVYVPQNRPAVSDSRYKYTTYSDSNSNTPGVKAVPPPVSKGTTRLGASSYSKPPVMKTPSSGGSSSSKGDSRSNSSSGSSASSTKASGSSSSNNSNNSNTKSTGGGGSSGGSSSKGSTRSGGKR